MLFHNYQEEKGMDRFFCFQILPYWNLVTESCKSGECH